MRAVVCAVREGMGMKRSVRRVSMHLEDGMRLREYGERRAVLEESRFRGGV